MASNSANRNRIELLSLLAARMEHLSVDSHWARRASGLRGNIIKVVEEAESGDDVSADRLDLLTGAAFDLLRRAARDIPDIEAFLEKIHRGTIHN